jgi:diaminopimelate epimerase
MIPFAKGHGLGNDYIVMEEKDLKAPLSQKAIERICDRNWGVGSDGILLLVLSQRADFGLRIFNPDGSEAEKSGNGLRIFAKYLWERGRPKPTFTVDTKGGIVECQCRVEGGRMGFVTVEMGRATFRAPEIPMNGPDRDVVAVPLQLGDGTTVSVTAVSVGNPHCVTFVERLDESRLPATRAPHREPSVVSQPDQRAVRAGGLARNAGDPHLGAGPATPWRRAHRRAARPPRPSGTGSALTDGCKSACPAAS